MVDRNLTADMKTYRGILAIGNGIKKLKVEKPDNWKHKVWCFVAGHIFVGAYVDICFENFSWAVMCVYIGYTEGVLPDSVVALRWWEGELASLWFLKM